MRWRSARALKPGVLVRSVVDHQLGDDPQPALVSLLYEALELFERAVFWVHSGEVGDVISVVATGRGEKRLQPDRGHAQLLDVVELFGQSGEVADPVAVAVVEASHVYLVDDRVLVPAHRPSVGPPAIWRNVSGGRLRGAGDFTTVER